MNAASNPACDRPKCTIAGPHDHVDAVVEMRPSPPRASAEPPLTSKPASESASKPASEPAQAPQQEAQQEPGLMGLLGDALDEIAGVSESFTGKPSSLRDTAKKVRKVDVAGQKVSKLGEAIQNSKLPTLGKKIVQTVKDNTRMREYHK